MNRDKQIEEMAKDISEASWLASKRLVDETKAFVMENHRYHSKNDFDKAHSKTMSELEAEYLISKGYRKTDEVNLITKLTDENEKLKAMVDMWRSTAYCEKDRLNSIKADTVHKINRDLYVELSYIAGCQKDNEPNMRSGEVYEALDRVTKRMLLEVEDAKYKK